MPINSAIELTDTIRELIDIFIEMNKIVESYFPIMVSLTCLVDESLSVVDNANTVPPELSVPPELPDSSIKFITASYQLLGLIVKATPLIQILSQFTELLPDKRNVLIGTFKKDDIKFLSLRLKSWNNIIDLTILELNETNNYISDTKNYASIMICILVNSCDIIANAINDVIKRLNEVNKDKKDLSIDYLNLLSKELSIKNNSNVFTIDELPKQV
jgi:hypothetical protein